MIYMKSINSNDGTMRIDISFDVGTDPDMNTVLTQNRVSAASAKLPAEVTKYGVTTKKAFPNFVALYTLTSDGRYDQQFLNNYALINIKDQLARVKGVGLVDVLGGLRSMLSAWLPRINNPRPNPSRLAKQSIHATVY